MKIVSVETFPVNVPFSTPHMSRGRNGTTEVLVKITTDTGLVGWGESAGHLGSAAAIDAMVRHAAPLVIGRDPWDKEAIATEFFRRGTLHRWTRLAHFAYAGIDTALWDLCGKDVGKPIYQLLGGAVRTEIDHCCHLFAASPDAIAAQCRAGLERNYTVFYLPVGTNPKAETEMLEAVRATIGPDRKMRVDANELWTVNQAIRILNEWDAKFRIEFCEAPVPHDLPEAMAEVRAKVPCAISANECLTSETDVLRHVKARSADIFCFSSYWVGTLRRFMTLAHMIHMEGLRVTLHTMGELGILATATHHAGLCVPDLTDGNQQMAPVLTDDVVTERLPVASGPKWGLMTKPGLGVEVDEAKVRRFHEAYKRDGQNLMPEYRPKPAR